MEEIKNNNNKEWNIPNELKLFLVKYEGVSYVYAQSEEEAISNYHKTGNYNVEKVTETKYIASYIAED